MTTEHGKDACEVFGPRRFFICSKGVEAVKYVDNSPFIHKLSTVRGKMWIELWIKWPLTRKINLIYG